MIAAMSQNRVIGVENRLPWRIPEDLKRFKEITLGHPVIMGRNTFESIGRPLPGRKNIVLTRQPHLQLSGVDVVSTLDQAINLAKDTQAREIFIIGGAQIYQLGLSRCKKLYLTIIEQEIQGDAFFPEIPWEQYKEISLEKRNQPIPFRFLTLEKI